MLPKQKGTDAPKSVASVPIRVKSLLFPRNSNLLPRTSPYPFFFLAALAALAAFPGLAATAGRAVLHISSTAFQCPSGCCFHTHRYLPKSATILPFGPFIDEVYVPWS